MIIEQFFILIFKLVETIFKALFELAVLIYKAVPNNKKSYNATFASQGTLLSRRHYGFCLNGRRNLSAKHSYTNALICGTTGGGKSSVVLIPSLFSMKGSFIVHDPSGELYMKTAGYLAQKGYDIKRLHFANPEVSSGYNPITRAKNNSDIQKIASMMIETSLGGKSKDPFWTTLAASLISMLIEVLKTQDATYQNMYNVRQLLNRLGGNTQSVDSLFSNYASEELFAEYKSFVAYDEKVTSGVIATCKAATQIFNDENVAKVTSVDSLDFQSFREKNTVLYIQNSVPDMKYYSILTSIFFEQFFSYIMSRFPKQNENDLFLLIDEASSLNLPTLPIAIANVRKHRAGIMLLVQDFAQIKQHYGKDDADSIKTNCFAKMYFPGSSLETAKELEQVLGQYQYEDKDKKTVTRSLLTSDEIRMLKDNRALLICGNLPPIQARLKPYYKQSRYRKYSQMEAPENYNDTLMGTLAVLPLNIQPKPNSDENDNPQYTDHHEQEA